VRAGGSYSTPVPRETIARQALKDSPSALFHMKRNCLWTHHDNEHLIGTTVTDGPRCLFAGPPREQTASQGYQHPDGGRWPPGGEASFFSFAGAVLDGFGVSRDIFPWP
jgi:hypothetical protein